MTKTDKDGYPTTCSHCHQPIVKRHCDSEHRYDQATHTARSWHLECSPAALRRKETP